MGTFWHGLLLVTGIWSAWRPADLLTWWLEMAPAVMVYIGLLITRRSLPLTPLSYWLVAILLLIIAIGAHYGFGAVPLFDWIRVETGGTRNNFDKLAHFVQGFVPAVIFREMLIRCGITRDAVWLVVLTLALTLALSALYELVEWVAALVLRDRAEKFIASQGDPFDSQSDMALALLGAIIMLIVLSRCHDRQIPALQ